MLFKNLDRYWVLRTELSFKNGLPKGAPALYRHRSKGITNKMCYLGTKLFHSTFLIQNGPPKGPPALYWHDSKVTSNQKSLSE